MRQLYRVGIHNTISTLKKSKRSRLLSRGNLTLKALFVLQCEHSGFGYSCQWDSVSASCLEWLSALLFTNLWKSIDYFQVEEKRGGPQYGWKWFGSSVSPLLLIGKKKLNLPDGSRPIYEKGQEEHPGHCRPVSLTSVPGKQITSTAIRWHIQDNQGTGAQPTRI